MSPGFVRFLNSSTDRPITPTLDLGQFAPVRNAEKKKSLTCVKSIIRIKGTCIFIFFTTLYMRYSSVFFVFDLGQVFTKKKKKVKSGSR